MELKNINDSRELTMDILKHGTEVEVKSPQFLIDSVRAQIDAMQKNYKKIKKNLAVWGCDRG